MRKFSYKRKTALIRTLKEPKTKKKRFNFDRIIYFVLLALLAFFAIRYVYEKLAKVEANGFVFMDKVDVNFPNDIRLQELYILEGDTVSVAQPLFSYSENQFTDSGVFLRDQSSRQKITERGQGLQMSIDLLKLKIAGMYHLLEQLAEQEEQILRWILLDVQTIDALEVVKGKIAKVKLDLGVANGELELLKQQLDTTHGEMHEAHLGANFQSRYLSPIDGVIGLISKNEKESCYRTENVLTIHDTDNVFVKAYFKLSDIEYVKEGAIANITFPDEISYKGIIQRVYVATYEAPSEFQKKYEPTERNIMAHIIPLDASMTAIWSAYHKLSVSISLDKV